MKNSIYVTLAFLTILFSCKKDNPVNVNVPEIPASETLSTDITENLTLKPEVRYLLKGKIYVKNNATLTIPSGVVIEVEKTDDKANKGALIITKGAKLNVSGSSDKPVIFTSAAVNKSPGDWIGIIVLGKAATNLSNGRVMGFANTADNEFGGDNNNDNSGSIKYLRLEYTGGLNPEMEEEWELDMASGLSLMGVGSFTQVENVMVTNSKDDGFQFVGGNVNAKHLLSFNNGDDDFDFDRGYTGKLQFLVAYRSSISGSVIRGHGMESLNDKGASEAQPYTRPVISNMTIIGPPDVISDLTNQSQGIYIRRNTRFVVRNSIISGYTNGGLMMCSRTKPLLVNNKGSQFKFNLVNADIFQRAFTYDDGPTGIIIIPDPEVAAYATETSNYQKEAVNRNSIIETIAKLNLTSLNSTSPNVAPQQGSAALGGGNFSDPEYLPFFSPVEFRGAVGTQNWTIGNWTNWK